MHLANAVVLVTGANRGIGLVLAREAMERGARKVYAAARDPVGMTRQVKQGLSAHPGVYLAAA